MSIVSLPRFLRVHAFLPPDAPTDARLDEILSTQKRKKSRSQKLIAQNDRLWGYSRRTPLEADPTRAFAPIRRCLDMLGKTCTTGRPPLSFLHIGERTSRSSDVKVPFPDACFYRKGLHHDEGCLSLWHDIIVPAAFQLMATSDNIAANSEKIVRLMARCILHNPCRRFVYGFTIEDSFMRLWYCDRSQITCSQAFNFITDYRPFLRFALFCMSAELHTLGVDPTMTPLLADSAGEVQYDISVCSGRSGVQVYRTLDVLFDGGSERLLGRGTRVFKAIRIENGEAVGDPVVLKDCWVDAHREREGDIDARIRKLATALQNNDRTRLTDMLLTVLDHGDVIIAGRSDSTPLLDAPRKRKICGPLKTGQTHYRIVYREACKPLRDEASLHLIFRAMVDVCGGLYSLHRCGWIHGDISANNILLHGDHAILSGLEYAKCQGEIVEHDTIGTHNFIPVELQVHDYIFASSVLYGDTKGLKRRKRAQAQADNSDSAPSGLSSDTPNEKRTDPDPEADSDCFANAPPLIHLPPNPIHAIPIRYNPRHDLEAVWWVSLSFVFLRVVSGALKAGDTVGRERLASQKASAWTLFLRGDRRHDALAKAGFLSSHFMNLHPTVSDATWPLDVVRKNLVSSYIKLEQKYTEQKEFDVPRKLHTTFREAFCTVSELLHPSDIKVEPLDIDR